MNELSLFTGAGGGILGSQLLGHRIVCVVEIDAYCREVLLRRQEEGILKPFPIWDDVRTFDGKPWRGKVDCISAGFPCQPFSVAGKRRGADDERNMWPDTIRIIGEVRPRYALLENVPGLLVSGYMGRIFGDISELGYDCRWGVIGADDVRAPHRRKRLWIYLADACNVGFSEGTDKSRAERKEIGGSESDICGTALADPERPGLEGSESAGDTCTGGLPAECRCTWWDTDPADLPDTDANGLSIERFNVSENRNTQSGRDFNGCDCPQDLSNSETTIGGRLRSEHARRGTPEVGGSSSDERPVESFVGRVAHGVAYRVDRLKAIGNGQVPRVAQEAWERLRGNTT